MTKWNIDPDHSVAAFTVRHMKLANVRGQFNKINGMVLFDFKERSVFSLEATIDVAGIYTGIVKRDEHLNSPDFFNVVSHPKMIFRSAGFELQGTTKGKLTGELTICGITRPINFDMNIAGPVQSPKDMGGETSIGITARSSINREDFGMIWNMPLVGGGVMVGTEIEIYLDIEADQEV